MLRRKWLVVFEERRGVLCAGMPGAGRSRRVPGAYGLGLIRGMTPLDAALGAEHLIIGSHASPAITHIHAPFDDAVARLFFTSVQRRGEPASPPHRVP